MIDFLYRSRPPGYKGQTSPTTGSTGFLSSLGCYLFGGGALPAYKTADAGGATAPTVSRCWWSLSGTPQYRTPPVVSPTDQEPDAPPVGGEPVPDDCGCQPGVEGREIHIYPGP